MTQFPNDTVLSAPYYVSSPQVNLTLFQNDCTQSLVAKAVLAVLVLPLEPLSHPLT